MTMTSEHLAQDAKTKRSGYSLQKHTGARNYLATHSRHQ